jgi:hypothetical protein
MKAQVRLTAAQPSANVSLDFDPVLLQLDNPTSSEVLVRVGNTDAPERSNADLIIPAAKFRTVPVVGRSFGLQLGTPSRLQAGTPALGGLSNLATALFVSAGEALPVASDYGYAALSSSDALAGLASVAAGNALGPFDLGVWGGLIVFVADTTATVQTRLRYDTSADQLIWQTAATLPLYPSSAMLLTLPRLARYARLFVDAPPGLGGVPNVIAFARPTLSELLSTAVQLTGIPQVAVNVAGFGTQDIMLYTPNLGGLNVQFEWIVSSTGVQVQWFGSETGTIPPPAFWPLAVDGGADAPGLARTISPPPPYVWLHIVNGTAAPITGKVILTPVFTDLPPSQNNRLDVRAADGAIVALGSSLSGPGAIDVIGQLRQLVAYTNPLQIANTVPFRLVLGAGVAGLVYNPGVGATLNVVALQVSSAPVSAVDVMRGTGAAAVALLAANENVLAPVPGLGLAPPYGLTLFGANNCVWVRPAVAATVAGTLYFV